MRNLCRIDIKRSREINKRLTQFVRALAKRMKLHAVYLFGSFSRDDFNEGSDIDLAIVGKFKERFLDRSGKILELTDLPIEPLCYTIEEFEKMKRESNPIIFEILKGKVLYKAG